MSVSLKRTLFLAVALAALPSWQVLSQEAAAPAPAANREEALRAKQAIEDAILKDTANSVLWLHLGYAYRDLDDVDGSQRAFEKCVELNPKNARAHMMLGLIYEKKKLTDKAITSWKAVLANTTEERLKEIADKHLTHLQKK